MHRRLSRRQRRRIGSTIVQAAIVLPVMLLFLFGILEYSRYVMLLQVMTNAAREGCRYAVMHTDPVTISSTTYGNATSNVNIDHHAIRLGRANARQPNDQHLCIRCLGKQPGTWENAPAGSLDHRANHRQFCLGPAQVSYACPRPIPITAEAVMRSEGN